MKSLADRIEEYIRFLVERSETKTLELQRTELAETFNCVPSQITYVLATRFTPAEGFVTESRRGGKGYVRIRQIQTPGVAGALQCSQSEAWARLETMIRQGLLNEREAALIRVLVSDESLAAGGNQADAIRGRMLDVLGQWLNKEARDTRRQKGV